ncbi:MAG: DinB family protein [Spirochaetota bacterium]
MHAKDVLTVFVRVNEDANRILCDTLSGAPDGLLTRSGGYFGSVMGTLNHILVSELGWMNRFRDSPVNRPALDSPALDFTRPEPGTLLIGEFAALRVRREQVDAILRRFVEELDEDSLSSAVEQPDRNGAVSRWTPAFVILHLMNHATHHRGQISQVLDEAGIEHDFSGILHAMRTWT